VTTFNDKKEVHKKYIFSYYKDISGHEVLTSKYSTPDGAYNSVTEDTFNAEKNLLEELEKNDKGQIENQILVKYGENGLPIERYEYLSSGVSIRLLRYEYLFY